VRVILLENSGQFHSSNVYLLLGNWSRICVVNMLVDVKLDTAVLDALPKAPTGVGKRTLEQVVLTHGHNDHVELREVIRDRCQPVVCAFRSGLEGVDRVPQDSDEMNAGNETFEVLLTLGTREAAFACIAARERCFSREILRCWSIPARAPMNRAMPPRSRRSAPGISGPFISGTVHRLWRTATSGCGSHLKS